MTATAAQSPVPVRPAQRGVPARVPPHSARSERALLGSLLQRPELIERAQDLVQTEDFYALRHQHIWRAMLALAARSEAVDIVTVETELVARKLLEEVGGMNYLQELFDVIPTAANLDHYAAKVKEKSVRRRYIAAADTILSAAYEEELEVPDLAEGAERALASIKAVTVARPYHHLRDVVAEAYQSIETVHERKAPTIGVPCGLRELDGLLSGLQASDLVILAARPSVGKSALSLYIARTAAAAAPGSVLVFSLEMSRVQLALRLIAMESGMDLSSLRTGRFAEASWEYISAACGELSNQRIVLDDARDTTLREMRSKARRVQAELGLSLVIVDYLQLMEVRGPKRQENRQVEVAALSRGLKQLAGEFNVPVLALSQLSREVEKRTDKRPQLSDLRESGAIEQDADVVLFLHREERYRPEEEELKGLAEVIVAKQRNGPLGVAKARFRPETGRFFDFAEVGE